MERSHMIKFGTGTKIWNASGYDYEQITFLNSVPNSLELPHVQVHQLSKCIKKFLTFSFVVNQVKSQE